MRAAEDNSRSIILSDWRHHTSDHVWEIEQDTGLDAYCGNSLLINGKGSVSCLAPEFLNDFLSAEVKNVLNGTSLTDIGYVSDIFLFHAMLTEVDCSNLAVYPRLYPSWNHIHITSTMFLMDYSGGVLIQ